ncbi:MULTISPECIES: polyprenyl synthetase family protein [unclassified Carboxylicivirga]|uniref:polyprenyl synthetase family protein n=1 Tax=Carboxylicivirga TaxID=1628153 RepID=UPI003D331F6F
MEKTQFKYEVPTTREARQLLRNTIRTFVDKQNLTPPLSMDTLANMARQLIDERQLDKTLKGWIMVELHNAVWFDTVASIPHKKRLLLLPKCLRNSSSCKADIDELGLLCNLCTQCNIPDLQTRAEELGMMSLVAEGFTSVVGLVESGVVDAVIGVSCLDSLEKAFPLLINNAVPGLAIPLNEEGCKDTTVDESYVYRIMEMKSEQKVNLLNYDRLKATIQNWFQPESLSKVLSPLDDRTSLIARQWMAGDGKRWRPYLLAATYMALSGESELPEKVKRAAIAIECFHKASLVHDDIEDEDLIRYGKETVNATHGVPMAINVGDMYLGEGYRLLAQCEQMGLIKVAAEAHIALCKGQGMELEWSKNPQPLNMDYILDIFKHKTVPAFEVSLLTASLCADDHEETRAILSHYSHALGIAYQLKDDVEDFDTDEPLIIRPSAVIAAICEDTNDELFVHSMLHTKDLKGFLKSADHAQMLERAIARVQTMVDCFRKEALAALNPITNTELKRLLFRVTGRILK